MTFFLYEQKEKQMSVIYLKGLCTNLLSEADDLSDKLVILEKTIKEHIASLQKPTEMTDPRLEQMINLQSKTQEHILFKNCHFNNIIQGQEL